MINVVLQSSSGGGALTIAPSSSSETPAVITQTPAEQGQQAPNQEQPAAQGAPNTVTMPTATWLAYNPANGDVVGAHPSLVTAIQQAQAKGVNDPVLMKVEPTHP